MYFKMNQADVTRLISKLRIKIRPRHRNMKNPDGPVGRLNIMREHVNAIIKYERIEVNFNRAEEARGYVERLISDAIRHGDTHEPTMEMASYYLKEKQLVHKLFKVLVPRFKDYQVAYTTLYRAPKKYPDHNLAASVLELKGNPFPPLVFDLSRHKNVIHNVLLEEARKEYRKEKDAALAAKVISSEQEEKEKESTDNESKSQAAQEISEGEQLLKSVSTEDPNGSEKTEEIEKSNFDEKPLPVV